MGTAGCPSTCALPLWLKLSPVLSEYLRGEEPQAAERDRPPPPETPCLKGRSAPLPWDLVTWPLGHLLLLLSLKLNPFIPGGE